jgi:hypothetical protein
LQFGSFSSANIPFFKEPLIGSETAISARQNVNQSRLEVVEFDCETGKAIVQLVIFRQGSWSPNAAGRRGHTTVKAFTPFSKELMDDFAIGTGDGTDDFTSVSRPIRSFDKGQFTADAPVAVDGELTILVYPTLTTK